MSWMNSNLATDKRKQVFCAPEKMSFTDEQVVDVLNRYVEDNPEVRKYPVGGVMLQAFRNTFPCKE